MGLTAVKRVRLESGRRQIEVARSAGLNAPRLSLIENGWVEARPDEIERIAAALGVTPRDIAPAQSEERSAV